MTKSPITSAVFLKNKFLSFLNIFFYTIAKNKWLLIVFVVGIALRLVNFGFTPGTGAVNQDETFAGYEAYSLLKIGIDSYGYASPYILYHGEAV